MAEGGSTVTNEEPDEESLFMLCGVCRKTVQESNPKLLPCLHSFCFTCLQERFHQQQQQESKQNPTTTNGSQGLSRLKCPTCGQEFLVPQKGIAGFLDNQFMLESWSKLTRKKESSERVCTSCEDKSPATSYCIDCTDWLCDACVQAHQRVRVTKDHSIQTMEEYRANASVDDQRPIFCTVHTHEPLKLFCGNCEKLTCRDCQLLEHKDHKYQFVKESAVSYREYLRAQLNRLYEQAQPLTESIKDIEKAARGLQEREEVITAEIHKACDTLVKAVKSREGVLITELKALVHFKHKLLAKQNKDLRLMQKILQHNYGFTRHVLKSSSDMTLLYSKKQLSSRIQNLLSLKYKVNPVAHSDLKFSMDAEKMASFIGKIGSVITPADKASVAASARVDTTGFRSIASTSGMQQPKAGAAHDSHRSSNPYDNLTKRLASTPSGTINNLLTVKLANGQSLSSTSLSSTSPIVTGSFSTDSYKIGTTGGMNKSVAIMPKGSVVSQPTMSTLATLKYAESVANHRQMQASNYNKTQPLHHYLGGSPPQRPASTGSTPDMRPSHSPKDALNTENGFGQGMITNVRSLKNSYIRRPSTMKRTFCTTGMPSSPSQPRIKQERQDSFGEYSTCSASKKQQQEDGASGESGIDEESANDDWCAVCRNGGELLCCDTCPRVFHLQCHVPVVTQTPSDNWSCGLCHQLDVKSLQAESGNSHLHTGNKRRTSLSGLIDWERKTCEKILLELFCHADSIPFQQRVSKAVPNYYKVIGNPMDLSTMRAKLQPQHFQHYTSITEFLIDCKLIFQNCQTFNDENSEVGRMGNNLELYFMTMVQKYLPDNIEIPEVEPAILKKRREDAKAFIHSL